MQRSIVDGMALDIGKRRLAIRVGQRWNVRVLGLRWRRVGRGLLMRRMWILRCRIRSLRKHIPRGCGQADRGKHEHARREPHSSTRTSRNMPASM